MDQACSKPSEGAEFCPVGGKKNNGFSTVDAEGILDVLLDLDSSLLRAGDIVRKHIVFWATSENKFLILARVLSQIFGDVLLFGC